MKESKYQVLNWKRWKATAILLKETKKELENTTQAISYSNVGYRLNVAQCRFYDLVLYKVR